MNAEPWSVYQLRSGRHLVRPYQGNRDLVAIFTSQQEARDYARRENKVWLEERAARRGTRDGAAREAASGGPG